MLIALLFTMLTAPQAGRSPRVDPIITKAQHAYDDARYEKALNILGDNCKLLADPVACERLRAFVHIALGESDKARAAFDRMLSLDPSATLGDDVSPKIKQQFADAQAAITEVQAMRVERPHQVSSGSWLLEVRNPSANNVDALAVFASTSKDDFIRIDLSREGEVWVGTWRVGRDAPPTAQYYFEASLAGGAVVEIGTRDQPFELTLGTSRPADETPPQKVDDEEGGGGLPSWAPWAIGAGVGAAVITAVIVGVVVATQGGPTGAVAVNIHYEN